MEILAEVLPIVIDVLLVVLLTVLIIIGIKVIKIMDKNTKIELLKIFGMAIILAILICGII